MTTNFIGVLLPNSPDYTVNTGFSTELYDAEGGQTIIVQAGASLELLGALGANTIKLAGKAADWQVYRDGSNLVAQDANGSRVEIPANTTAQNIVFSDTSLALRIEVNGSGPAVLLGSQVVDTVPAPAGGPTPVGSTEKAPWTLVMASSQGVFGSDGTAAGTKVLFDAPASVAFSTVIANSSLTDAIFAGTKLYGTDGTSAGTSLLSDVNFNFSTYDLTYYKLGNKIAIASSGSSKGVVSDGTVSGTVVLSDVPKGVADPATQSVWGSITSSPYGSEIFRTVITANGAESGMVKDIRPGTAGGAFWSELAVLSNGKAVFAADDGAGERAWISDGTALGTYKLTDANAADFGSVSSFTAFGQRVAFRTFVDGKGYELAVTDGTSSGTKLFDIAAGPNGSFPEILGAIDGVLYFTAYPDGQSFGKKALMSTDGTTVRQLAELGDGAELLGWGGGKAFVKASDATHGQELWAVNLADGATAMVKDILPGTGSALADTHSINVFMVGNKLVFSAYTAPNDRAIFVSDGTAAGTWQLSSEQPGETKVVGENIFFTDSAGIHVADGSGKVSLLGSPAVVPPTPYIQPRIQADDDQAYFISGNGALLVSNGGPAVRIAESSVSQLKVVAENAAFFIKAIPDGTQSLWFTDGTTTGTRLIRVLPQGSYDLSHGVGLHTNGVPVPAETHAPELSFGKVYGNSLTLTFTDTSPLDSAHLAAPAAFQLAGTDATVTAVAVDAAARTITLSLSHAVKSTDVVLVSYTDPTSGNDVNAIQDSSGNDAASFAGHFVQNLTPDNVAPVLSAASVDGATLTLTYAEASSLDGSHLPVPSSFRLDGTSATVTAVAAAGSKLILTLSQPVLSTDNIKFSYTDPTDGNDAAAVQDAAGNDAASVSAFTVQNATQPLHGKAPWTLLVSIGAGVYASDGTTAGSKLIYASNSSTQVVGNSDYSAAMIFTEQYDTASQKADYFVLGVDGSGAAPVVLAHGLTSGVAQVMGKYFVVANNGDTQSSGLVSDGTVAGTHLVANLPTGWMDAAHKNIWSPSVSAPYGYELYLTHISDSGAVTSMVKDISPGSSTGFISAGGALVLANGKLVFVGSDPVSGAEPWVSDGTEAGTIRLAELQPGANTSYPRLMAAFGSLAAVSAVVYKPDDATAYLGRELVVTDGTVAGTHVLDIATGPDSSDPQVIGAVGGTLYFTAFTANGGPVMQGGLFSTDGVTFKRLADVSGSAYLLGQAGNKIFFAISDQVHGQELWVSDSSGTFTMVKDILPGTGSGISGTINPVVVGDKLMFQAYTSATTQNLFISDGTAGGTISLGPAAIDVKQAGHMVVYGDGTKIYGLDALAAVPQPQALAAGVTGPDRMQADADQVFFSTATGDLFATDGTSAGTAALGHSVQAFKVVGENSLYFVEQVSGGTGYTLNYSDGTAAGTYFVSNADIDFVNHFDRAVVVHTVGVPPAQH